MNNELIQQARELCDAAKSAKERGNALDSAAMSWAITNNCVPQLCDALEAMTARAEKAESYICQLKKQLSNAMKERDTYKAEAEKQRWIPASERLPEIIEDESSAEILIAVKYAYDQPGEKPFICCGYLLDGEWWSYTEHNCHRIGEKLNIGDTVTHWRPLPEPPEAITDDAL